MVKSVFFFVVMMCRGSEEMLQVHVVFPCSINLAFSVLVL